MPSTTCYCGTPIAGPDRDAQVAAGVAHFREAHPEVALTEVQIRNHVERADQLTGPSERLTSIGTVEVVPITPDRLDDVLAFFDTDAFADNPNWASCYCMAHHEPDEEAWGRRTWQQNRFDLAERIRNGTTTGTLAYVDGKLAAWLNASPRRAYPEHCTRTAEDDTTGHVECFVVATPYRGHGIARQLLAEALGVLRDQGCSVVTGRPARDPQNAGSAYHGTLPLFRAAGFDVDDTGERRVTVRRRL
jgi:GNAT superfamily N-acetyltransferase